MVNQGVICMYLKKYLREKFEGTITKPLTRVGKLVYPIISCKYEHSVKGALSGLRQFSATESSLKMMKDAFNFTFKALFVLKISFRSKLLS